MGHSNDNQGTDTEAGELYSAAVEATEESTEWWNQEWLKFPTVTLDSEGLWGYWDVPQDSGVYAEDWKIGEGLARETVAHMQKFQDGSSVLRRIFREMDFESTVAQGFLTRIEDMLTNPQVYLDSLEPGAVQAKIEGN